MSLLSYSLMHNVRKRMHKLSLMIGIYNFYIVNKKQRDFL